MRRRGDPDVKALLLGIKRLHGVLILAHELTGGPAHAERLKSDHTVQRLVELLGEDARSSGAPAGSERKTPSLRGTTRTYPNARRSGRSGRSGDSRVAASMDDLTGDDYHALYADMPRISRSIFPGVPAERDGSHQAWGNWRC